ncbi:Rieske (2Fe-2S) protein [Candidatus Nitronereus thalassa]|uniref:Rieske 2Fe-2S domain-containing protein n=1 Tax=Candidatus Nitronereus thalassa TaxID=3020898 RepID=A0ABU3KCP5_9BACT|nr:Rieske 2Fe-2S domain-containing protein [Candidatus Nitronereus thalassa]MDT7044190.1 Rieske 2Fe-2S domain-containing protein [Candidatus Nitronereus thalassa]
MNEKSLEEFVAVGRIGDIPDGSSRVVKVGGKTVALFNVSGKFFAINNICPHEGGPLAKGKLKGYVIGCPWHDLQFDVRSGFGTDGGGYCVASYDVKVKEDEIYVSSRCRDF